MSELLGRDDPDAGVLTRIQAGHVAVFRPTPGALLGISTSTLNRKMMALRTWQSATFTYQVSAGVHRDVMGRNATSPSAAYPHTLAEGLVQLVTQPIDRYVLVPTGKNQTWPHHMIRSSKDADSAQNCAVSAKAQGSLSSRSQRRWNGRHPS